MHAQAKPERPKGEGHGWPEFYSPQMRPQGHGDSEFSLSRIPTAQTPWPGPYALEGFSRRRCCVCNDMRMRARLSSP